MKRTIGLLVLGASFALSGFAASLDGYIVDQSCAGKKAMWSDSACVARCVRRGSAVVLVTDDGTVYKISNQDKITADTYGKKVTVNGKVEGDTVTVDNVKM